MLVPLQEVFEDQKLPIANRYSESAAVWSDGEQCAGNPSRPLRLKQQLQKCLEVEPARTAPEV